MIRTTFTGNRDEGPTELDLVLKQYEKKIGEEADSTTTSELALSNVYGESETGSQSSTGKAFKNGILISDSVSVEASYNREEYKKSGSSSFVFGLIFIFILMFVGLVICNYVLFKKEEVKKWPKRMNRKAEALTASHSMLNVFIKDDTVFSKGFPKSYSIFADNKFPIGNEIPLFFDLPGKTSSLIPSALSNCLGFVENSDLSSDRNHSHFIITDDLCGFASNFSKIENRQQVRLFLLLRNPLVRTVVAYKQKGDPNSPYFNEGVSGLTFKEYLNSVYVDRNPLTRSLICKENAKLNQGYLVYAMEFLKRRCTLGFLQDYKTALLGYRSLFENKVKSLPISKEKILHCASQEFYASSGHLRENIIHSENVVHLVKTHLSSLMKVNRYDMQLYRFALNSLKDKSYDFEAPLP